MRGYRKRLEPGLASIVAVGVAELFFQHLGFFAGANHLHRHDDHQEEQPGRFVDEKEEAGYEGCAKEIDGIANLRVQATGDEFFCPGPDSEGFPQLDSRHHPEDERRNGHDQPDHAGQRPRPIPQEPVATRRSYKNQRNVHDGFHLLFHGLTYARVAALPSQPSFHRRRP